MSTGQPNQKQTESRRRLVLILGAVLLFLGIYVLAFLLPDLVETAAGPQTLTLVQAADIAHDERTYASIEGGSWDCASLREVRGVSATRLRYTPLTAAQNLETRYSTLIYADETRDHVLLVMLSGSVDCPALSKQSPTGYLFAMQDDTRQDQAVSAQLRPYAGGDSFMEMCGYCGQQNSLIGAAFGFVFVLIGLPMIVLGRRIKIDNTA